MRMMGRYVGQNMMGWERIGEQMCLDLLVVGDEIVSPSAAM
jgi:hypothetical protein